MTEQRPHFGDVIPFLARREKVSLLFIIIAALIMMFYYDAGRMYWPYIPSTIIIAFLSYAFYHKAARQHLFVSFRNDVFNRNIWLHPSAINDYFYVTLNVLLLYPIIQFNPTFTVAFMDNLMGNLSFEKGVGVPPMEIIVLYTVCQIIVLDFFMFLDHYLLHKVPILWKLHKVHHSALVMTPFTAYRIHPLETLFTTFFVGIAAALNFGIFYHFYPELQWEYTILGAGIGTFFFNMLGANLRHSGVWLSYGPKWGKIFISPAQHQYHHSNKKEHVDKNMGFIFALWDWMFGTLILSDKQEKIDFGLGRKSEEKPLETLWGLYVWPVIEVFQVITGRTSVKSN